MLCLKIIKIQFPIESKLTLGNSSSVLFCPTVQRYSVYNDMKLRKAANPYKYKA